MLVRIIKDWSSPAIMRQTPLGNGVWDGVEFTLDPVKECDYLIVLNRSQDDVEVNCPPENVWLIIQEPPVHEYDWLMSDTAVFSKIITANIEIRNKKIEHDSLALPWHVDKSYDELLSMKRPTSKPKDISWITSNAKGRAGHRQRMDFLRGLQKRLDFDLYGRGFSPIDDKFEGIYPYKYTLAVENHSCDYYWTEKIADCFLSWSMPIYFGCSNIESYFPESSFVRIDISDVDGAVDIIRRAVSEGLWEKNIDAIELSRNLILKKYQIFPYLADRVNSDMARYGVRRRKPVKLTAKPYLYPETISQKLARYAKAAMSKSGFKI